MMTTKDAFDAIKHGDLDALTAALDAGSQTHLMVADLRY
jgi:hypothetical protein